MNKYFFDMFNKRKENRLLRFSEREVLTLEDIYSKHYAWRGFDREDIFNLWETAASHLGIEPGRLRPEDRFDGVLAPAPGTEDIDEIENLTVFVSVKLTQKGEEFLPDEYKTIDDVIRRLAKTKLSGE